MGFYFLLSGTLFILCLFGVFQGFLNVCKLNRWIVSLFLLFSCILSVFNSIKIATINVNLNLFLYLFFALILLFQKNTAKGIWGGILTFLITISVLVVYYTTTLSTQILYIEPIVYLAIVMGVIFAIMCQGFQNIFCGTLLGAIVFQIAQSNVTLSEFDEFEFFNSSITTYLLVCYVSYVAVCSTIFVVRYFKLKKHQKNLIN